MEVVLKSKKIIEVLSFVRKFLASFSTSVAIFSAESCLSAVSLSFACKASGVKKLRGTIFWPFLCAVLGKGARELEKKKSVKNYYLKKNQPSCLFKADHVP